MQFALVESKPVQVDPDALRYAQCVYCGMVVELIHDDAWCYYHTSDLSATKCQKLRDREQAELERVLNL